MTTGAARAMRRGRAGVTGIAAVVLVAALASGCSVAVADAAFRAPDQATSPTPTPAASPTPSPSTTSPPSPTPSPSSAPAPTPSPSASPGGTPGRNPESIVAPGPAWTTRSVALLTRPADPRSATAHVGRAFPLVLTARSRVVGGARWVEARWRTPSRSGTAWVPLAVVAMTRPASTASASLDALDRDLYRYVRSLGTRVGVYTWDLTRSAVYSHNGGRQYLVASSIKVEILCWFLSTLEREGREPTRQERELLTAMIVRSDNDAAEHFYRRLGDAPGMTAYMARIGVAGLTASPAWRGWGWSTVSPGAQARVFALLRAGKLLDAKHTAFALDLLGRVIPEHRVGVGTTAPKGADVAMKVGWVVGPDGMWVMNSSGIVTHRGVTYVIAVYTERDTTLEEGWAIVERVTGAVAKALLDGD